VPGGANQEDQANNSTRINLRFSPEGRLISVADDGSPDELNQGDLTANVNFRIDGDPNVRTMRLELGRAGVLEGITSSRRRPPRAPSSRTATAWATWNRSTSTTPA